MSQQTSGDMGLTLPEAGEKVRVSVFNTNFSTIDSYCTQVKDSVTQITSDMTAITNAQIDALFT
jgi:hypothetical protein